MKGTWHLLTAARSLVAWALHRASENPGPPPGQRQRGDSPWGLVHGFGLSRARLLSARVVRVREPVLKLGDAVEELADENGAGMVEAKVTPQALRFGQPCSADG